MKALIGKNSVELDFSNRWQALKTRAYFVIAYDELGIDGDYQWECFLNKRGYFKKAFQKALLCQ